MNRSAFRVYESLTLAIFCAASVNLQPASAASKPTYAGKMEMGQMLFFNGDIDRAIRAFEAAAELNPKALEPHMNLLNLYIQKGGEDAIPKAIVECSEVIKRKPGSKDVHLVLGNLLRNQAQTESDPEKQKVKMAEAVKEVETAEALGARKSVCEYTVGMIDLQQGNTDKAMTHIEAALADQPDLADAHMVHAVLTFKQLTKPGADGTNKDFQSPPMQAGIEKVLDELELSIKQKGKNPEAHNTKAEIDLALGRIDQALAEYRKAVQDEPKYTQAWVGIGTCEAQLAIKESDSAKQQEYINRARDAFEQAKKLNPNDKNTIYGLAVMLEKMGRIPEAVSEFENSLMLESDPMTKAQLMQHVQQLRGAGGMSLNPAMSTPIGTGVGSSMFTSGALSIPMKDLIKAPEPEKKK